MRKNILIIIISFLFLCLIAVIISLILKKRPSALDYEKTVANYPECRMLQFDESYYFNNTVGVKENLITGTVWRVDYNGHTTAFKFNSNGDYIDFADFYLTSDETRKLWECADSLEGNYVPDGYDGYAYSSVLYKYNSNGEKYLKKYSGLPSDDPLGESIYKMLSDNYQTVLDN
jgi:hypothetical protein